MVDVPVSLEHTVTTTIIIIITILTYQAWLVTARCAGDCRATSLRLRLASGQVGPAGGVADHVGREGSWVEEGTVEVSRLHPPGVHP